MGANYKDQNTKTLKQDKDGEKIGDTRREEKRLEEVKVKKEKRDMGMKETAEMCHPNL